MIVYMIWNIWVLYMSHLVKQMTHMLMEVWNLGRTDSNFCFLKYFCFLHHSQKFGFIHLEWVLDCLLYYCMYMSRILYMNPLFLHHRRPCQLRRSFLEVLRQLIVRQVVLRLLSDSDCFLINKIELNWISTLNDIFPVWSSSNNLNAFSISSY